MEVLCHLVQGKTFYVRKDYSQHQARFYWPWSSLRHHIPPQQLTPVHPIYHSITRSQFNRSTFKLVPQNLLSIYAGTNWDDNELVTIDVSKSLSSKRVQLPKFFYTRHLDRMTWAPQYAKLWNHSTHIANVQSYSSCTVPYNTSSLHHDTGDWIVWM